MKTFRYALTVAVVLWASVSFGAVAGTLHDLTATGPGATDARGGFSLCEYCHIPHAGGAKRLWADSAVPSAGGWNTDTAIAPLCGSCHYNNIYPTAGIVPHNVTNTAYNASAHGYTSASLPGNDTMASSNLPYTDKTYIECSSCHDPHNQDVRPFMRLSAGDVETLCELCHQRGTSDLEGNLNSHAPGSGGNLSMHPVRLAYTPSSGAAYEENIIGGTADSTWMAQFGNSRGATEAAVPATPLGGKLLSPEGTSGNMGCPTCHQVHGDEGPEQNAYLLTIDNQPTGWTESAFCEACHLGTGDTVMDNSGSAVGSHPVRDASNGVASNGMDDSTRYDFTAWTGSTVAYETLGPWPFGAATPGSAPGSIGCSSCHSAHYGENNTPMLRTGGDAGQWCSSCHTLASAPPFGHHSNVSNMTGSLIDCVDCHEGEDTNLPTDYPTAFGLSAAAHQDWLGLLDDNYTDRADFCLNCHGGMAFSASTGSTFTGGANDTNTGVYNPTTGLTTLPATHGTTKGGGSHYIGTVKGISSATARTIAWEGGAYSMYGVADGSVDGDGSAAPGTTAEIICESCHSIVYNIGAAGYTGAGITASATSGYENNLLLANYVEDDMGTQDGATGGSDVGSLFCVGCHTGGSVAWGSLDLDADKPAGTHPVTGSDISKVVDSGLGYDGNARATTTLITSTVTGYANVGPSAQHSYPNTDAMDCDSCHRVHDADGDGSVAGTVVVSGTARHYVLEDAAAGAVQSMCTNCHGY